MSRVSIRRRDSNDLVVVRASSESVRSLGDSEELGECVVVLGGSSAVVEAEDLGAHGLVLANESSDDLGIFVGDVSDPVHDSGFHGGD